MKKIISILIISAILTGCGHISEDKPYVAEETTTVSQITETTASDAIDTTTSAETVTSEVTRKNSSQSVTEKTAESVTTAAANTDIQLKKERKQSQNSQDNGTPEVKKSESKTTTKAQTSPPRATTAPAEKENKTTTTVCTSPQAVTTAPPVVTQPPKQTEPPRQTEPQRQTEPPAPKQQILDYESLNDQMQTFIDGYDIDYDWLYDKGKNLSHDGTDYGKAVAVCNEAESLGGVNCINYAINAYFMAQGAGLECYIARSSDYDWYGHVANIIKLDGKWYYMEPMGDVVGSPTSCPSGGIPYPNGLDIVTDIYDNRKDVTVESDWYK